jgi:hypothetical protein
VFAEFVNGCLSSHVSFILSISGHQIKRPLVSMSFHPVEEKACIIKACIYNLGIEDLPEVALTAL